MEYKFENGILYVKSEVISQRTGVVFESWEPLIDIKDYELLPNSKAIFATVAGEIAGNIVTEYIKNNQ